MFPFDPPVPPSLDRALPPAVAFDDRRLKSLAPQLRNLEIDPAGAGLQRHLVTAMVIHVAVGYVLGELAEQLLVGNGENGHCESFNSKLRDELLNFYTLKEAKLIIGNWRRHSPGTQGR